MAHLFVYGTLLSAFNNEWAVLLRQQAVLLGAARVRGQLFLHPEGWFPVLAEGNEWVHGQVYQLPAAEQGANLLRLLDQYEGYTPEHPEESLYVRQQAAVWLDSQQMLSAWLYRFTGSPLDFPPIEESDFLAFWQRENGQRGG